LRQAMDSVAECLGKDVPYGRHACQNGHTAQG
jgi:hypothetical protein